MEKFWTVTLPLTFYMGILIIYFFVILKLRFCYRANRGKFIKVRINELDFNNRMSLYRFLLSPAQIEQIIWTTTSTWVTLTIVTFYIKLDGLKPAVITSLSNCRHFGGSAD